MNRSKIQPGQYFLMTIGISDSNHFRDFTGEFLMRITSVKDGRVSSYNLTTEVQEEPDDLKNLTDDDTRAIDKDLAERVWRMANTLVHERLVGYCGSTLDSYQIGEASVDVHATA